MTPEQFAYWLQGFAELTPDQPTMDQWAAIKQHLSTVFDKTTPAAPGDVPSVFSPPSLTSARFPLNPGPTWAPLRC